ncbi:MAG: hypothetical protein WKG07_00390 [Hymenobacter sp.]
MSELTVRECIYLLDRIPDAVLPNGLNIERFVALHEFQNLHKLYKDKIHEFVMAHFFQSYSFDLDQTLYFFTSGRYEYHNKGFDLTLGSPGPPQPPLAAKRAGGAGRDVFHHQAALHQHQPAGAAKPGRSWKKCARPAAPSRSRWASGCSTPPPPARTTACPTSTRWWTTTGSCATAAACKAGKPRPTRRHHPQPGERPGRRHPEFRAPGQPGEQPARPGKNRVPP